MPISRDEFDSVEWSLDVALTSFLRDNGGLAFTATELIYEVEGLGIDAEVDEVEEALARLIRLVYVESRCRRDAIYYSHDRSLGFRLRRND